MKAGIAFFLVFILSIAGTVSGLSFTPAWETVMPDAVVDVAASDDGGTIAVLTGTSLACFDADGTQRWTVPARHSQNVGISGDGSLVVTGGEYLQVYDGNGETAFRYENGYFAYGTAISRDGTCVAAGFDNASLFVFRKNETGVFERTVKIETDDDIVAVALSGSGDRIAAGEKDGAIRYYTGEGRLLWSYDTGSLTFSIEMSGDGEQIFVGADHGVADTFNGNGRLLWKKIDGDGRPAIGIAADGSLFALGGDGIELFARDGSERGSIAESDAAALAVAGNGTAISAAAGKTVTLYRPAPGTTVEETAAATTMPTAAQTTAAGAEQPTPTTPAQSPAPIAAAVGAGAIAAILNGRKRE